MTTKEGWTLFALFLATLILAGMPVAVGVQAIIEGGRDHSAEIIRELTLVLSVDCVAIAAMWAAYFKWGNKN